MKSVKATGNMVIQSIPLDAAMKEYLLKKCKAENVTLSAMLRRCIVNTFPELSEANMNELARNGAEAKPATKIAPATKKIRHHKVSDQEAIDYFLN